MSKVDLVFVATDEGTHLIKALESLFEAEPDLGFKVYVVDNASSDGVDEQIADRWPEVTVLRRDRRNGLPSNLNHGIRAGSSQFVMLCNSDLLFGRGAVTNLASFLESHPTAGIAAPKLIAPDGTVRASARRWYTPTSLILLKGPWKDWASNLAPVRRSVYGDWDMASPRQVEWVPCPATMVRRAAFDAVGLMDERFRVYFDDVDISLRMHREGWEVWCVPGAEIIHIEQRSSVTPLSKAWWWHLASLLKFWWKHKSLHP